MKKVLIAGMLCFALSSCSNKSEVVPVVSEPDPTALLAQPPASAMLPPHEPVVLQRDADNATALSVMRTNNLNAADDRAKLSTLQEYIRGIFTKK